MSPLAAAWWNYLPTLAAVQLCEETITPTIACPKRTICFSSTKHHYWSRGPLRNILLSGPELQTVWQPGNAWLVLPKLTKPLGMWWHIIVCYTSMLPRLLPVYHHANNSCRSHCLRHGIPEREIIKGYMRCFISNFAAVEASFGSEQR